MKLKNNLANIRRKDEGSFFNPSTFKIYQVNDAGNKILNLTESDIEYEHLIERVLELQICNAEALSLFIRKCLDNEILLRM